jgi:multidrug resistance protein, MATE family
MAYWYRRVFVLAIPLILSNLTQPLLSTVDTVLSGHLPGAAALGGVAMGGIFFNGVFWTFGFLRMGTTGLVAQAYGAHDTHALRLHLVRAMLIAFLIGSVILVLQGPLIAGAIALLGASAEVRANALLYCHIRIWSAPAALASYAILGDLLGRQRARTALALQAAINVVNVAVALVLVLRLHWGVAGIATATLVADWTGCLLGLLLTRHTAVRGTAPLEWHEITHAPSLRHLFALNRDILLRTAGLVLAYAWFTRTGARAGDAVLAANAVLMNLHLLASYALDGFANATEALVGEAIGAQRRADFHAVLRASTTASFLVAGTMALVYLVCGHALIGLYTNQAGVGTLAVQFLPWVVALPVVSVWGFQLDGVFIGATRARDLRDSMLLSVCVFLLLAVGFERFIGNHGLWAAFCLFNAMRGLTLGMRLKRIEQAFAKPAPVF